MTLSGTPSLEDDIFSNARSFRDTIAAQTTARGRNSIARVWQICEELAQAGKKISVASVGTETEKRWGSPKQQSIRDQPERLKRLVDLMAATQSCSSRPLKQRTIKYGDDLTSVADQGARARLRQALQELDEARSEIQMLKKAFRRLAPIDNLSQSQCMGEITPARTPIIRRTDGNTSEFTTAERNAASQFLDAEFLYSEGFLVHPVFGLTAESGRIILPIEFIDALKKVASG